MSFKAIILEKYKIDGKGAGSASGILTSARKQAPEQHVAEDATIPATHLTSGWTLPADVLQGSYQIRVRAGDDEDEEKVVQK